MTVPAAGRDGLPSHGPLATWPLYGTILPIYIEETAINKRLLLLPVLLLGLAAGCTPEPTPPPAFCVAEPLNLPVEPRIPPVTEADHVQGPANAPITIIEYADFQ